MSQLQIIKPLNGIRSLAILLVLIWHYFSCLVGDNVNAVVKTLKILSFCTWSGVDLFFVLSGFLIGRILIYNKRRPNYFKAFYLRRIFRIFPAYYLVISVFILFTAMGVASQFPWLMNEPMPMYSYLLFIQNFWMHAGEFGPNWLGVTWSLAVEEQFYILLPLLIFLIKDKWLPMCFISGIIAAPFFRAYFDHLGPYVLLPARMDALLAGALIAYLYLSNDLFNWFAHSKKLLVVILFLSLATIFFYGYYMNRGGIGDVMFHSLLMLFYSTLLILVLVLNSQNLFLKLLSTPVMNWLAEMSFMIYLTHQIFSGLCHQLLLHQTPKLSNMNDVLVTLLALVLTLTFSRLSYLYFERPILNYSKKFSY